MPEREMTMVERVSLTLCCGASKTCPLEGTQAYSHCAVHAFMEEAVAAIKAIMQPTIAMVDAGVRTKAMGGNPYSIFTSMIDAALSETPAQEP